METSHACCSLLCRRQPSNRASPRGRQSCAAGLFAAFLIFGLCQSVSTARLEPSNVQRQKQPLHKPRVRVHLKETSKDQLSGQQRESELQRPIRIAIMTGHYFGNEYARSIDSCSLEGVALNCTFFEDSQFPFLQSRHEASRSADAVWWHAPNSCFLEGGPWGIAEDAGFSRFKARADQLAVVVSMESSAYYKCLDEASFMAQFDVDMTYRRNADVPLLYWGNGYKETWGQVPPLPVTQKKDAVVYINSNCQAPSGRNEIVEALKNQPGIVVDGFGTCLNSGEILPRGAGHKFNSSRQYKYCIAMENSVAMDYVTEKVYDALAAGCVPIYLGAPNIADFVPTTDAIIDYNQFGTPEALAAELRRLSADDGAYEEKLRWRQHPETWGEEFRKLVARAEENVHPQCQLCQVIARHRIHAPDPYSGKLVNLSNTSQPLDRRRILPPRLRHKRLKIKYILADAPPSSMEDVIGR